MFSFFFGHEKKMENNPGVPVEYTPVEPAPPAPRDFYKENQVEIVVQKECQKWIRRGLEVLYWPIGLCVAIVLRHYFHMYVHCLKETCTVSMALLDFGIFVVTVAIWEWSLERQFPCFCEQ
jgi:hypothetical protein